MAYKNGKDVLPPDVLNMIQNYVSGEMLYIPQNDENRLAWGELSGSKDAVSSRNKNITILYKNGTSIDELTEEFCLSESSIRKIIHKK